MVLALAGLSTMTTFMRGVSGPKERGRWGWRPRAVNGRNRMSFASPYRGSRLNNHPAGQQLGAAGQREFDQRGEYGGRRRAGCPHQLVAADRGRREELGESAAELRIAGRLGVAEPRRLGRAEAPEPFDG